MDTTDLELKLLSGVPINVGIGNIYPLKLSEVRDIGDIQYNKYVGVVNVSPKVLNLEETMTKPFDFILYLCAIDPAFRNEFIKAMIVFFREEVHLHESGVFFIGNPSDSRKLDGNNIEIIRDVIRKQNFLSENKDEFDGYKIAEDEQTKRIMEMRKKIKERIKKENKENGLDLSDVISIVASHHPNINFFNVWDLTIFQLYTLYSRLMMKENYESNFAMYVQYGDPSKLDLNHWARKLKNRD